MPPYQQSEYMAESANSSRAFFTSGSTTVYIAAGGEHHYTFTSSFSGKCSFWTTGSLDTYISVYRGTSLTTCLGTDDDDNHSYNACITVDLMEDFVETVDQIRILHEDDSYTIIVQ